MSAGLEIIIEGVRDSMGCYFSGVVKLRGEIVAVFSAWELRTCLDMALEALADG